MQWKDISSYSQGDAVRTPKTFELRAARLRVVVTRHIGHPPDAWVLNCSPFGDGLEISNGTADEAKAAAVEYVLANMERAIAALTPNVELTGAARHERETKP